jgi:subtilisin family serine protease
MNRRALRPAARCSLVLLPLLLSPPLLAGEGAQESQTRVLVRLAPGLRPAGPMALGIAPVDRALARRGTLAITPALAFAPADPDLAAALGLDRWWVVSVADGAPDLAADLARFPDVIEVAQADGAGGPAEIIPTDPYFDLQWSLQNTGQDVYKLGFGLAGADISAPGAWDLLGAQRGLILAVIDSGVDHHAELNGRVLTGWSSIEGSPDTTDQCDHGTHVAGIAAAEGDNGQGIAGVCWWATILPVRVIESDCSGVESQAAAGIVWAADHGASIANISLQYYSGTQLLADAIDYAHARGMLLIAAAGNNAGGKVAFPAKFDRCLAVSATGNLDTLAPFSNYGDQIDVAAPGHQVYSLLRNTEYKYLSGTSMAAPHVSGLACLIWSINPALSADEVAQIIISTTDDLGEPGWDNKFGSGRLNAEAAIAATPCYADLNRDGKLTFHDYLQFQNALASLLPVADCDRSSGAGVYDLFDFLCFQNAFMQGCP